MVLDSVVTAFRTVARSCVAVLFAIALAPLPARAIPVPDSVGFARLERLAGASGRARLSVQWRSQTIEIRKASYDSTGIRGGERELATQGLSSVWSEVGDSAPIPWSEVERLRVPGSKRLPVGPIVGASLFGLLGVGVMAAVSAESQVSAGQAVVIESSFMIVGAVVGAIGSAINPFRKPAWVDF